MPEKEILCAFGVDLDTAHLAGSFQVHRRCETAPARSQRARLRQERGGVELVRSPVVAWRLCPYALAYNASSDGTNLVEAGERAGGSAAGVRPCGRGAGTHSGPARHHGPTSGVQRGDAAPEAPGWDSSSGPPG